VPYLLGGGLGCWARGGPPSSNDIDLMLKRADAERALEALAAAGMRPLDDILVTKLFAPDEHSADYRDLLQIARSLREQVDWPSLRERTSSNPFAAAFFVLVDRLRISLPAPLPIPEVVVGDAAGAAGHGDDPAVGGAADTRAHRTARCACGDGRGSALRADCTAHRLVLPDKHGLRALDIGWGGGLLSFQ